MNSEHLFGFNGDSQRIRLCVQDRGIAGDTFYTLIIAHLAEPRLEQEIDYNQPFKNSVVSTIPASEWDNIIVDGKRLSEHVQEKLISLQLAS
jgi:hypothetical protein